MIQSQTQFGGGINTVLPKHRLPDGVAVNITDADVYDGTLQEGLAFNSSGGGASYYYEAGETWVGNSGFSDRDVQDQLIIDSSTGDLTSAPHVGNGTTASFNSPLRINFGFNYTIESTDTITILTSIRGLYNANSFVEYNRDLYVGRSQYNVEVASITTLPGGNDQITLATDEISKVHEGDQLAEGEFVPSFTEIVSIEYDQNRFTINTSLTGTPNKISIDAIPIRVIDGNLNNTYSLGLKPPEPNITYTQVSSNTVRNNSHTTYWYSLTSGYYPIPYQYGLSKYDLATGAESSMSDLTDPSLSAQYLVKDSGNTHKPVRIAITNIEEGQYALYRTGGTSSVLKKVATLALGYTTVGISVNFINSGADLEIQLTGLPTGRFRLNPYPYSGTVYNYDPVLTEPASGNLTFTLLKTAGSSHYADIFIEAELSDDPFKRISVLSVITIENGAVVSGLTNDRIQFLDFTPPQSLIDIQPITSANMPPANMKFLTEVNNFFFGVEGRVLYISRYADPNNWPLDGYLNFDNAITGLSKRGSDLLVFTTFNLYRVFGSSPESMRKVKIPSVEGCPAGLHKCIQPIKSGVVYVSQNGLQYFSGADVKNLSENVVRNFQPPSPSYLANVAGVYDNRYFLLSNSNDGYVLDFRDGIRLTRSSLRASNLHYRGNTNKLYNQIGELGAYSTQGYDVVTRSFDGGDRSKLKVFRGFSMVGEGFDGNGSIQFLVDGSIVETFSSPTAELLGRTFRLASAAVGLEAQIQLVNIRGRTIQIDVEMDFLEEQTLKRWNYLEIQYTGTLTINFSVDGDSVITNHVLPNTSSDTKTAQIFFPTMTEGEIGHLHCEETETNKLLRVGYNAEEI